MLIEAKVGLNYHYYTIYNNLGNQ